MLSPLSAQFLELRGFFMKFSPGGRSHEYLLSSFFADLKFHFPALLQYNPISVLLKLFSKSKVQHLGR
jgi:hypothetical protein